MSGLPVAKRWQLSTHSRHLSKNTEKQIKAAIHLVDFSKLCWVLLQIASNMCNFYYRSLWQASPVSYSALTQPHSLPVGFKELHQSRDFTCMHQFATTLLPLTGSTRNDLQVSLRGEVKPVQITWNRCQCGTLKDPLQTTLILCLWLATRSYWSRH